MRIPVLSLSEPASLVLTGFGFLVVARAYRAAAQRKACPESCPSPWRLVLRSCLVVVLSVLATSCGQDPEVAKRAYLESGDAFVAAQKYPEAIVQYRNAMQQDARFGEARSVVHLDFRA